MPVKIILDLSENLNPDCAFFALYAGLRMYKERRESRYDPIGNSGGLVIVAAEAYCILQKLKEDHPEEYQQAEEEYNRVYSPEANN